MPKQIHLNVKQEAFLLPGLNWAIDHLEKAVAFSEQMQLTMPRLAQSLEDLRGHVRYSEAIVGHGNSKPQNVDEETMADLMASMELSARLDEAAIAKAKEERYPTAIVDELMSRVKQKRATFASPEFSGVRYSERLEEWGFQADKGFYIGGISR